MLYPNLQKNDQAGPEAIETCQLTESQQQIARSIWESLENHDEKVSHTHQVGPHQCPRGHRAKNLQPKALSNYSPWPQYLRQGRPSTVSIELITTGWEQDRNGQGWNVQYAMEA